MITPDDAINAAASVISSSTSVTEPFPSLDARQLELLDRVVNTLDPGASSWAAFEDAYERLQVDEDEIYPLGLKLTFEKGLDWRDKWHTAKQSLAAREVVLKDSQAQDKTRRVIGGDQHVRRDDRAVEAARTPAKGFDLLKARVDQVTSSPRRRRAQPERQVNSDSAVSDARRTPQSRHQAPSEGGATPSSAPRRQFLVEHGQGYSSADDYVGVPHVMPPSGDRRMSIDVAPRNAYTSDEQGPVGPRHRRTPSTLIDSARHPLLEGRLAALKLGSSPARSPSIDKVAEAEDPKQAQLEQRADSYRQFCLLRSSCSKWLFKARRFHEALERADYARDAVLTKDCLDKWRQRLERVKALETVRRRFQRASKQRLKQRTLAQWKGKVERRRRDEWEVGLREAWDMVRASWREKQKGKIIEQWWKRTLSSRAERFRKTVLLAKAFSAWQDKFSGLVELHGVAERVKYEKDVYLAQQALKVWENRTRLRIAEARWVDQKDAVVKERCFNFWLERAHAMQRQRDMVDVADAFRSSKLKSRALTTWIRRSEREDLLYVRADAFRKVSDQKLVRKSYSVWVTEWTGQLVHHSRSLTLLKTCMSTWTEQLRRVEVILPVLAQEHLVKSSRHVIQGCWDQWRDAFDCRIKMTVLAHERSQVLILRHAFVKWQARIDNVDLNERKADVAREFFLQRRAWNVWTIRVQRAKAAQWLERKRRQTQREVLHFWLAQTKRAQTDRIAVQNFQTVIDMRIVGESMSKWTKRLIDLRSRELDVQAHYDQKLIKRAFAGWAARCIKLGDMYGLAESFLTVNTNELRARVFVRWLGEMRRRRELKRREEQALQSRAESLLVRCFDRWREASLWRVEREVAERTARRNQSATMDKWKSKTKFLPALQFYRERTLLKTLRKWRAQVTDPELLLQALEWDYTGTVGRCLEVWRIKTQARIAVRSVHRFRSITGSTPNSSMRTSTSFLTANSSTALNTSLNDSTRSEETGFVRVDRVLKSPATPDRDPRVRTSTPVNRLIRHALPAPPLASTTLDVPSANAAVAATAPNSLRARLHAAAAARQGKS
ncbi:hypothetical protein ACM66B_005739 [Microbotryomycetes sp. NB124-2]